jgi:elongation of very long chain fatty acids protein 4
MSPVQVKENGGKGSALPQPTLFARYSCAALMIAIFAAWGNVVFVDEAEAPGIGSPLHDYKVPLLLTSGYLLSLPLLRSFTSRFLSTNVDVKVLLKETMLIYNGGQVLLNGWMVYKIMDAVLYRDHPFFGDVHTITGASFAVWVHYMDKYLEFFDTFFMVLRGRMDQVRGFYRVAHSRVFGNPFLHPKFVQIGFLPSCLPSRLHCLGMVVCCCILARW